MTNICPICGKGTKTKETITCSLACRGRKQFLDRIKKMQSRFKNPLKEAVLDLYNSGKTMREVGVILGMNKGSAHDHIKVFNYLGITRRPVGGNQPGGVSDSNSGAFKKNMVRMKKRNPTIDPIVRCKMAQTKRRYLLDNPSEMTVEAMRILKKAGIPFEQELVFGNYLIDFAIGNVALEIDGRGHASRRKTDAIRDDRLRSCGWEVIRINSDSRHPGQLRRKLKELIASGKFSCRDKPAPRKDAMIWCQRQSVNQN